MGNVDYLVVGAGFAGSVCAERLAAAGHTVLVVDQRSHVGGNAYDRYDDHGILIHQYGAHIFHTNSETVWDYLSRFTGWHYYTHRVLASVRGQLVPVPINQTTVDQLGDVATAKALLYDTYTRKQWGCEPEALLPTVTARVKARDTRDDRYFTDRWQGVPQHGYTRLFQVLLAHANIAVLLKTSYTAARALGITPALGTIYTGPVDEYFDYADGRLPYRSARFEFQTFHVSRSLPAAVVNYPIDYAWTRVAEFTQITGQVHQWTTICYETPQAGGQPYWPVPTVENQALAARYKARAAAEPRVHFLGRLGTYAYLNMDQVVAQALKLARALTAEEGYTACQTRTP